MGKSSETCRLGNEAIQALEKAAELGESVVARSSIADVWAERREYDKAAGLYRDIPGWEDQVAVRTALADILRSRGEFRDAVTAYDRILDQWPDNDRAIAGKAEIARHCGDLGKARQFYERLIHNEAVEQHDKLVYRVATCGILKQLNHLDDAYKMVEEIIHDAPFLMSARIQRSTILGLLGEERRGLNDMPALPSGVAKWTIQYYRGLLLLKLKKVSGCQGSPEAAFRLRPVV